jgi:hypothetical protein
MESIEHNYAKTAFNPVKVKSIQDALKFLNSLVTDDGKPFFYHRIHTTLVGKSKPIDCYEILKANGEKENLFINIYNRESIYEIPNGYVKKAEMLVPFVYRKKLIMQSIGVNYRLKNCPEDLLKLE